MKKLILASTSRYRRAQLESLAVNFSSEKPLIDEENHKNARLKPKDFAESLARLKAESLLKTHADAIIIGGDQVVSFQGQILGKPHNFEVAFARLKKMAGHSHELITSIAIASGEKTIVFSDITVLTMKKLSDQEIRAYLEKDQPYDCAGGYKIETSGIALFEKIDSHDFTAIQGLPLMGICRILKDEFNFSIFA